MKIDNDDKHNFDLEFTEVEDRILGQLGLFGESRRKILGQISAASLSLLAAPFLLLKFWQQHQRRTY